MRKIKSDNLLTLLFAILILLILGSIYFVFFLADENSMILSSIFFIVTSVLLLIVFIMHYRKTMEEDRTLHSLLDRLNWLGSSIKTEELSDPINSKKEAYEYIESVLESYNNNKLKIDKINRENEQHLVNLSHEIRTPLQGITGFVQLLGETSLDQDQKDCILNIKNSSELLMNATSNILSSSKASEDVMTLKEMSFDIFEKVESIIEVFSGKTEQKNITLGVYVDPVLSRHWVGDSEKITRILTNLINNSIQFTPIGGIVSLFVRGVVLDDNMESIHFSIQDNRVGIDRNMQKIIFDLSRQSKVTTRIERRSNDSMLVVSSKIVEFLGGKLNIETEKDGGITFSFTISFAKDNKKNIEKQVDMSSLKVGLALPDRSTYRDVDMFLEEYVNYFNAEFGVYYYDDLFGAKGYQVALPDVIIFDHRYARRKGYLDIVQSLDCDIVLITTNELKVQINQYIHKFDSIIMSPVTLDKIENVLEKSYKNESEFWIKNRKQEESKFDNMDVLVVEDNHINQKLIKALFEKFNLNVTLASNGKEALRIRKANNKFDLIFMDIVMPVMDGVEATKKILQYEVQNNLSHMPIIALTANALIGDKEKYIKAGMDQYLSKPIRLQKLKYILEQYIKN